MTCAWLLPVVVLTFVGAILWKEHARHKRWLNRLVEDTPKDSGGTRNEEVEQWRAWETKLRRALVEYVEANSAVFLTGKEGHCLITEESGNRILISLNTLIRVFKETPDP